MVESGQGLKSTRAARWAATLAATYAFTLAAAFFWTYIPRYFVSIGWTSAGIGLVFGLATLVRVIAMPTWARIAERTSSTTRVIQVVSTLGVLTLWALPFVEATWSVYLVFVLLYGTWNSFVPLADSLTVRQLGSGAFGRIRAFGSAGFGIMALVLALLSAGEAHVVVAGWAPWFVAVLGTLGAVSTWLFPNDEVAIRAPDLPQALRLLRRPALAWCFGLWALHWASQTPYNLFLVFLAEERHMAGWVPGLAVAVGVAAEVLVLSVGRRWVERFGPEVIFAASALVTSLRWALCAVASHDLVLVAIQLLHGITFGAFLLSAMAVLDREVPTAVRGSGQAAFYVLVFGIGSSVGNTSAGWLADRFGAPASFGVAAGVELAVAVVAILYAGSVIRRGQDER